MKKTDNSDLRLWLAYSNIMVKSGLSLLKSDARSTSTRKRIMAAARAALKEARMARDVVAQARADFKAHCGKSTLKIYRQALKTAATRPCGRAGASSTTSGPPCSWRRARCASRAWPTVA